jgi:hypothetical protein
LHKVKIIGRNKQTTYIKGVSIHAINFEVGGTFAGNALGLWQFNQLAAPGRKLSSLRPGALTSRPLRQCNVASVF